MYVNQMQRRFENVLKAQSTDIKGLETKFTKQVSTLTDDLRSKNNQPFENLQGSGSNLGTKLRGLHDQFASEILGLKESVKTKDVEINTILD